MMDDLQYLKLDRKQVLFSWALSHMMRGAGIAAAFVLILGLGLYALYGLGHLLPAASRETPPPMGVLIVDMPTAIV
jgi:Intrinsic membrane protein PufX